MGKRLITLKQIGQEKISRSRSWFYAQMKAGKFPKPLDLGLGGSNLWAEETIDKWIEDLIARAGRSSG